MDVDNAIRTVMETGKTTVGTRETIRAVRHGAVKLAIVAKNCPKNPKDELLLSSKHSGVPVYEYEGTSLSLGSACGKPFFISMLGILDAGDSHVLELGK